MRIIKWIKWIFSFLILIVAVGGIVWGTIYILNNNGIKKEQTKKVKKTIEKVTSNLGTTNLAEIYNIYLNQEKHKVKIEYQLINKSDNSIGMELYIYFDGKNVLEREVALLYDVTTIEQALLKEEISQTILINENSFNIFKEEKTEYLLVLVGFVTDSVQKYYYLVDNNGDLKTENGILVSDSHKLYVYSNGEDFTNYYDNDNYTLAKLQDNQIYALEENNDKKKLNLVEYKYYFKDGKLKKDKIMAFEDLKIKVLEEKE